MRINNLTAWCLIVLFCFSFTSVQAGENPTAPEILEAFASLLKTKKDDPRRHEPFHQEDILNASVPVVFLVVPIYQLDKETKTITRKTILPTGSCNRLMCFMAVDKKSYYKMRIYREENAKKWKKENLGSTTAEVYDTYKQDRKGYLCYFQEEGKTPMPNKEVWLSEEDVQKQGYQVKE